MFEGFAFEALAQVSNLAGAVGGIVAAMGVVPLYLERRRQAQPVVVQLQLKGEERTHVLPLEMLRKDVSRAELLGRLGMALKNQGQRFALKALSSPEFMRAINQVVTGKTNVLVIPVSTEELDQFAL